MFIEWEQEKGEILAWLQVDSRKISCYWVTGQKGAIENKQVYGIENKIQNISSTIGVFLKKYLFDCTRS